jgi:hypothetical protein
VKRVHRIGFLIDLGETAATYLVPILLRRLPARPTLYPAVLAEAFAPGTE